MPIKGLHSVNQALKAEPRLVYLLYNGLVSAFFFFKKVEAEPRNVYDSFRSLRILENYYSGHKQ